MEKGFLYLLGVFCYVSILSKGSAESKKDSLKNCQVDLTKLSIDDEYSNNNNDNNIEGDIIIVGIAGGSGSGKTTLAQAIYESVGDENITYISHDSYYKDISHLSFHEREKQNFDHPESLDTKLLIQHLTELKKGNSVSIPRYDFGTHSRKKETEVTIPRPIILVEGILIFTDKDLLDLIDIRVFVDTEDDIRLIRRIQRDTVERNRSLEGIITQYLTTVRPMHLEFVESSKRNAHIIVPVGLNAVALELVVSRLKSSIRKYRRKKDQSK
jgi:uridine kinase